MVLSIVGNISSANDQFSDGFNRTASQHKIMNKAVPSIHSSSASFSPPSTGGLIINTSCGSDTDTSETEPENPLHPLTPKTKESGGSRQLSLERNQSDTDYKQKDDHEPEEEATPWYYSWPSGENTANIQVNSVTNLDNTDMNGSLTPEVKWSIVDVRSIDKWSPFPPFSPIKDIIQNVASVANVNTPIISSKRCSMKDNSREQCKKTKVEVCGTWTPSISNIKPDTTIGKKKAMKKSVGTKLGSTTCKNNKKKRASKVYDLIAAAKDMDKATSAVKHKPYVLANVCPQEQTVFKLYPVRDVSTLVQKLPLYQISAHEIEYLSLIGEPRVNVSNLPLDLSLKKTNIVSCYNQNKSEVKHICTKDKCNEGMTRTMCEEAEKQNRNGVKAVSTAKKTGEGGRSQNIDHCRNKLAEYLQASMKKTAAVLALPSKNTAASNPPTSSPENTAPSHSSTLSSKNKAPPNHSTSSENTASSYSSTLSSKKTFPSNSSTSSSKNRAPPNHSGSSSKNKALLNSSASPPKSRALPNYLGSSSKNMALPNPSASPSKSTAPLNPSGSSSKSRTPPNPSGSSSGNTCTALPNLSASLSKETASYNSSASSSKNTVLSKPSDSSSKNTVSSNSSSKNTVPFVNSVSLPKTNAPAYINNSASKLLYPAVYSQNESNIDANMINIPQSCKPVMPLVSQNGTNGMHRTQSVPEELLALPMDISERQFFNQRCILTDCSQSVGSDKGSLNLDVKKKTSATNFNDAPTVTAGSKPEDSTSRAKHSRKTDSPKTIEREENSDDEGKSISDLAQSTWQNFEERLGDEGEIISAIAQLISFVEKTSEEIETPVVAHTIPNLSSFADAGMYSDVNSLLILTIVGYIISTSRSIKTMNLMFR